jgi:hypothetical protein
MVQTSEGRKEREVTGGTQW